MSPTSRPKRVGELIRHEIAGLLSKGLKDPRIGFVSVMDVRMSPDLQYANVYVSLYGSESERKGSLIALRNAAGWIRRELGKHLHTRVTPEVRFFPDDSLDRVYELENIFEEIHEEQRKAPMIRLSLEEALEELRQASAFMVTTHVNPDGDAVGSLLAMARFLEAIGKRHITCVMADPAPAIYQNLPGADKILRYEAGTSAPDYDVVVVVDVSAADRLGDVAKWLDAGRRVLIFDHHQGEGMHGAAGFVDTSYAAAGEIIHELFELAEVPLSPEAAHCLYVAQITDTGGYRYSNTNPRSHRIAATLLDTGVDVAGVASHVFDEIARPKFDLLQRALARAEFGAGGRLCHTYITAQDVEEVEARKEHLDGIINYLRNVKGVEVAAFFYGLKPEKTKVSLRSENGINAATFLEAYGGGGHAAAAGATVEKPMHETRELVVAGLESRLAEQTTTQEETAP